MYIGAVPIFGDLDMAGMEMPIVRLLVTMMLNESTNIPSSLLRGILVLLTKVDELWTFVQRK